MGVISRFSINCGKLNQNEEGHPGHKVLNWQWSFRRLRLVNHYVFQTVSSFLEAYRFCPQPALPSLNITCLFFYSIEARQDLLSGFAQNFRNHFYEHYSETFKNIHCRFTSKLQNIHI